MARAANNNNPIAGVTERHAPRRIKAIVCFFLGLLVLAALILVVASYTISPDHLGAPRAAHDSTGKDVWSWERLPYGNTLPVASGLTYNLRFPGQYYDAESKLHYNHHRDYDPALTGRYIQSDPIGLKGGVNTYAYALNNPVNLIDPNGLYTQINIGVGGTAAVMLGINGGLGVGIGVPDDITAVDCYQFSLSGQFNPMAGLGAYLGVGISAGISYTEDPLPNGFYTSTSQYVEVDAGPLGVGLQIPLYDKNKKPLKTISIEGVSAGIPVPHVGLGLGVYIGAGPSFNGGVASQPKQPKR